MNHVADLQLATARLIQLEDGVSRLRFCFDVWKENPTGDRMKQLLEAVHAITAAHL